MTDPDRQTDEQLSLWALQRFALFNPQQPVKPRRDVEHIYPAVLGGPPTPRRRLTVCARCFEPHGLDPCPMEQL